MPAELSIPLLITANVIAWPAIQLGLARAGERLPDAWFERENVLCRIRPAEADGRFYERWLAIRQWKDRLPDGARITGGGFSKRRLLRRDSSYLAAFSRETRRGELVHWAALLATPLFALWNPLWAMPFHAVYALAANLPCILVQRYNRSRLVRVLPGRDRHPA